MFNDRMVIFNGYPTSPNCGQQSQNLNVIGQSWADNCVGTANMPFQFIDDDCSYYNIILLDWQIALRAAHTHTLVACYRILDNQTTDNPLKRKI